MKERKMILGVLRKLGRRLWIARTIRETAFGVCVVLFCLVCFKLVAPALGAELPFVYPVTRAGLLLVITVAFLELVRRSTRTISAGRAAAYADAHAQLKDELKSAHWFIAQNVDAPFAQLQLQRAAATANRLDPGALAPYRLPSNALGVAALGVLLGTLIWMNPQSSHTWEGLPQVSANRSEELSDLHALLADAPENAEIAKLDLALTRLQQAGISAEARNQALADVRDAIDQANMEAAAARVRLAEVAATLKNDPGYAEAARAIEEGRVEDAMALLRKPSAAAARQDDDAGSEITVGALGESGTGPALVSEAQKTTGKPAQVNQDAMARVISALDQARERLEVQSRVNAVQRRMEAGLTATNQRSQLTASQFDTRVDAPNPTPSPDTGNATMRGGSLFRQAAVARETAEDAPDGSQTGDASGDAPALPVEGQATRRLDAQLKLETLAQQDEMSEDDGGQGDQDGFYAASREQKSMLQAQDVEARANYQIEGASDRGHVPIMQKRVVKKYFLNLHESEKK